MAQCDIGVLGSYQSDFSRNLDREELEIADLVAEVVNGTLEDAQIDAADVQTIHVGNAFGQLFNGQGQLGAMPATMNDGFWGVPAARHEAACASGSVAILAAMAELEAGRYDCALVIGVEQERNVPGKQAPQFLGAASWIGHEGADATYVWPYMFSSIADEYDLRYGLDDAHLRAIAKLNMTNAKGNPLAQTREWNFTEASFDADDFANPIVEGRLRRTDCSQVTDGGAGVVLVSPRFFERHSRTRATPIIQGWGHTTASLALKAKTQRSAKDEYVFPHVRKAVQDAFARAGVAGVDDLSGIETHDCFSMSEYVAIDHFGITSPGESWKAIENGDLERGGATPINPSGGLIGGGHPVGATGVRMLVDAARQVEGRAGACQVEGATRFATLNIGGSLTTTVSFIVGQA